MPQLVDALLLEVTELVVEAGVTSAFLVDAISYLVVYGGIYGGLYAYNRQQAKKASRGVNSTVTDQTLTIKQPAASGLVLYGQSRVGGTPVLIQKSGDNGEFLNIVIVHCLGEVDSALDLWLNEEEVPLDVDGNATGKYAGYLRAFFHVGTDTQTVDTELQDEIGTGLWSDDHRLRGWAYTYVRLKFNADLFPSGLPNFSRTIKGRKVYDPRSATTVWSAAGALCLRDYLTNTVYGLGADAATENDDAAVITAANVCDESITLLSGSENRYVTNGLVDTSVAPGNNIQTLMGAMAGICPFVGGVFKMQAGAYVSPGRTITLDDLVGSIQILTRDSFRDAFNSVKGVYSGPDTSYQAGDFPSVQDDDAITEDGEEIWLDIQLQLTTTASAAQRLAKIEIQRNRRDTTVILRTKLSMLDVCVGNNVYLTLARYGWTNKVFEVTSYRLTTETDGDGVVVPAIALGLRETDSDVWAWNAADDQTPLETVPVLGVWVPTDVTSAAALTVTTANLQRSDGSFQPRLHIQWAASADPFVNPAGHYIIEYKKHADSAWIIWSQPHGDAVEDFITDVESGDYYDVRLRTVNIRGVTSVDFEEVDNYYLSADADAPDTPAAFAAATAGNVLLTWNPNSELDLLGYNVYRNTADTFGSSTKIWGPGLGTQLIDQDVTAGTEYFYWLTAVDTSGNESDPTASVNGTPTAGGGSAVQATLPDYSDQAHAGAIWTVRVHKPSGAGTGYSVSVDGSGPVFGFPFDITRATAATTWILQASESGKTPSDLDTESWNSLFL